MIVGIENGGQIVTIDEHQGQDLAHLFDDNPDYIVWAKFDDTIAHNGYVVQQFQAIRSKRFSTVGLKSKSTPMRTNRILISLIIAESSKAI